MSGISSDSSSDIVYWTAGSSSNEWADAGNTEYVTEIVWPDGRTTIVDPTTLVGLPEGSDLTIGWNESILGITDPPEDKSDLGWSHLEEAE